MKPFDYCVYIGRFQPFHAGHYELLKEALNKAETVLLFLGSYHKAPDIENPWSAEQREAMIRAALTKEELERVKFLYVRDTWYLNNLWLTSVQQSVSEATDGCDDSKICIIGATNDFPQWQFFFQKNIDHMPHATEIRGLYFTHDVAYKKHVHPGIAKYMEDFKSTENFKLLKNSYDYIRNYRASWDGAPFPVTFVTVDCVVIKGGHVLMVRRRGALGKGQLALPGGFLNQDEAIEDGALRELKEETVIKVDKEILRSHIRARHTFDHPRRSLRGRIITHAFLIDLDKLAGPLPQVKGSDDAEKAQWISLNELGTRESECFEDHFHIVSHFTSKY
jgi:bifunctional NMN adenylyltransferase/nudix hydrolase